MIENVSYFLEMLEVIHVITRDVGIGYWLSFVDAGIVAMVSYLLGLTFWVPGIDKLLVYFRHILLWHSSLNRMVIAVIVSVCLRQLLVSFTVVKPFATLSIQILPKSRSLTVTYLIQWADNISCSLSVVFTIVRISVIRLSLRATYPQTWFINRSNVSTLIVWLLIFI